MTTNVPLSPRPPSLAVVVVGGALHSRTRSGSNVGGRPSPSDLIHRAVRTFTGDPGPSRGLRAPFEPR